MTESSNDILADRRFAWAAALVSEGDFTAAADLLEQAVERAPGWAAGWSALAGALERSGAPARALSAWHRVLTLDPSGRLGAGLHVTRLGGQTPSAMPGAYVEALFDDYAPRFERHLVEDLGYRGPRLLVEALEAAAPGRTFGRALDLGCGTGLMGRALAGRAAQIDGVDLSPRMVEAARASGIYAQLVVGPLDTALHTAAPASYDLVLAADVLGYLGELGPLMRGVARVLVPGGLFGFTAQCLTSQEAGGFSLGADMRFAHSGAYLEAACGAVGLALLQTDEATIRTERGLAASGLVVVAAAAGTTAAAGLKPDAVRPESGFTQA